MEELLAAHSIFAKGAHHDTPSATHDRRHASAESRPEHPNILSATGISVRTPLQPIARGLGPGGDPGLSLESGAFDCSSEAADALLTGI